MTFRSVHSFLFLLFFFLSSLSLVRPCIALHAHRTVRQKKGKLIPRDMLACNLLSKRSVMRRIWYWVNIDREKKKNEHDHDQIHNIYISAYCCSRLTCTISYTLCFFFFFLLSFRYLWSVHTYIVRDKRSRVGTYVLRRLNTYWKFLFFFYQRNKHSNLSKYMRLDKSIWSHKH